MRKVWAQKAVERGGVLSKQSTLGDCNAYSQKVTEGLMSRSISNLDDVERWIAPPNFTELLSKGADIELGREVAGTDLLSDEPIISTLPMPIMMDIVGWDNKPQFQFRPIWTMSFRVKVSQCDVYQTVYFPERGTPFYRASITGDRMIIEFAEEPLVPLIQQYATVALIAFNIESGELCDNDVSIKKQPFGKISPIDENLRKEFILHLSQTHNIYSLGRFATWRPVLLDDLIQDIRIIEKIITKGSYSASLQSAE